MSDQELYWIWSGEWNAWWRPDGAGYTRERLEAGRYTKEAAEAILRGCGPEKKLQLFPVKVHPFDDKDSVWETLALISCDLGLDDTRENGIYPAKPERIYEVFKELLLVQDQVIRCAQEVDKLASQAPTVKNGWDQGGALLRLKHSLVNLDEARKRLGVP